MTQVEVDVDLGWRFLSALGARDYEELGDCFADDGTLRAIVPSGLRDEDGREGVVSRFRLWTGDIADYELLETEVAEFGGLLKLRWVVSGVDPDPALGANVFEQTAYAEVAHGRIEHMRLACSGHRAV